MGSKSTFAFRWIIICLFMMISVQQWKLSKDTLPVYSTLLGVWSSLILCIIKYMQAYKPFGPLSGVQYLQSVLRIPENVVDLPSDVGKVFIVLSLLELVLTIWLPLFLETREGFIWLKSLEQKSFLLNKNTLPFLQSAFEYFYKLTWLLALRIEENVTKVAVEDVQSVSKQSVSKQPIIELFRIFIGLPVVRGMKRNYYWKPSYCLSQLICPHLFVFSVQIVAETIIISLGGAKVGRCILLHVTLIFNLLRGFPAFLSLWKALNAWKSHRCDWIYMTVAVFPCALWIYSTFIFCWRKWLPLYRKNNIQRTSPNTSESMKVHATQSRLRRRR
ncbi:hypothetical protein GpartN1_g3054.t1 [Galdieria partita]|uniref:RUN domain-containing protein n=1 Tax=Galdieria partita TaxID=83374 RepID=A0A9C7PUU1_9RHOD|nr:hypothetical protein GpartN1_g3054.t1 [Galdieria partita]